MIRLTVPSIDETDVAAVRDALVSGQLVQGPRVVAFEEALAARIGAGHAVAMSSGTAALHAALMALDVGAGDAVIVPAYSFVATANVVEICGAKPVFVDIYPNTFDMDVGRLEEMLPRLIRSETPVKAIMPVHPFGQLADMDGISKIAARHDLPVVEDAACALGAASPGGTAGSWGAVGCFSFHPRKAVTTGEGGVAITDAEVIARRLRAARNHGQDPGGATFDSEAPGLNYRMTELQAALGLTQLAKLDSLIHARARIAARYDELLDGSEITVPRVREGWTATFQSYVILLPPGVSIPRTISELALAGIEASIGAWHIPMVTYYRRKYGFGVGSFPVTEGVMERALSLPIHPGLTSSDQERVVEAVKRVAVQPRDIAATS